MIKNESCFPAEEAGRKKVGILGGTFDPIHTGHLILAETACEAFSLDYVLIMPNGNPPHKPGQVNASMEQRTRMAELAASDNDHFRVSDFEKTPQDYHYTYETLEFLTLWSFWRQSTRILITILFWGLIHWYIFIPGRSRRESANAAEYWRLREIVWKPPY